MSSYLHLIEIQFKGPSKETSIPFARGVNVICGASETGKSFLSEAVDFMLGGSSLREIPEKVSYASISLAMGASDGTSWKLDRAIAGGDFSQTSLDDPKASPVILRQSHVHDRIDNLSGLLLSKIGLLGKRILKSVRTGQTISLSFRNLARLVIIQDGEMQQTGSPFWDGQFTLKTAELATIKLLLTGIDDSNVISADATSEADNARQISLLDELVTELSEQITDQGASEEELTDQLSRLDTSLEESRSDLSVVQRTLDLTIAQRRNVYESRTAIENRLVEIEELLERFALLDQHYGVDKERLRAIQESGSMLALAEKAACPLCGASPEHQHFDHACDGNVEAVVDAATSEIAKIDQLSAELQQTVADLTTESETLEVELGRQQTAYTTLQLEIAETINPRVALARTSFTELMEKRSGVQRALSLYEQRKRLTDRRSLLIDNDAEPKESGIKIAAGIPDLVAHALSQKIESILKAWNFPGECRVHFDKEKSDFVIDGKPRGSRGRGLRAITHAAVTIGLLEYCQEGELPHPGFVMLDSPLLAYFEPEGADDIALQGSDLKERFYNYLIKHHGSDSQVVIIENQHPPASVTDQVALTIFTGNPSDGRYGLL